jgi:hypothetical protein
MSSGPDGDMLCFTFKSQANDIPLRGAGNCATSHNGPAPDNEPNRG